MPIALALVVIVGVIGGALVYVRRKSDDDINALIRQIADLDEQHENGDINHDVYQRRRARLKAQLEDLMVSTEPEDEEK